MKTNPQFAAPLGTQLHVAATIVFLLSFVLLGILLPQTADAQYTCYFVPEKPKQRYPRLAAEYEPQKALMLSISDWQPHHSNIFRQIVEKTHGHVDLVVLHNDQKQMRMAVGWLDGSEKTNHVSFSQIPCDTVWVRDFAPLFAETKDGRANGLDFHYVGGLRPKDEKLPQEWCKLSENRFRHVPWTLQGGNLLVNGKSLGVTTQKIFKDNYITFGNPALNRNPELERRKIVANAFLDDCNLKLLVVLEPLRNEATGHCDMFMTFVAADTVVVASLDPRRDPVNAAILDRNAERLSKIKIGKRPMNVRRIRIPERNGQSWSAYTNVIMANDLVLMPVFDSDSAQLVRQAQQVYKGLLPDRVIKTIDMSSMRKLQGELHCLSAHIPEFVDLPQNLVSMEKAKQLK